jgi:hypothetical protein
VKLIAKNKRLGFWIAVSLDVNLRSFLVVSVDFNYGSD